MIDTKNLVQRVRENSANYLKKGAIAIVGTAVIASLAQLGLIYEAYWRNSRYPPQWTRGRVSLIIEETDNFDIPSSIPPSIYSYTIYIEGINKSINFQLENWDKTVREGDTVDAVFRKSFLQNNLEGLYINDNK